jgi:hypothetical protein
LDEFIKLGYKLQRKSFNFSVITHRFLGFMKEYRRANFYKSSRNQFYGKRWGSKINGEYKATADSLDYLVD